MKSDSQPPTPQEPEGEFLSMEEIERRLVGQVSKAQADLLDSLWELGSFFSHTGRQDQALACLNRYLQNTNNPERQAGAILGMGQLMEQMQDYPGAITFYSRAMSLEPESTDTWYLINNNLGYCLNIQGRFSEAEAYCREAIRINPVRHNAYKNLGISQAGQAQFAEAARNYIQATHKNPRDSRALNLLEQIIAEHPEIETEIPDVREQLLECRARVEKAGSSG